MDSAESMDLKEKKIVTIVQYDLTSSEDEELDPTVTYIMSSSKLSPPCITVSEDDSSQDERWNVHLISPVVQSVSTSCEKHSDEQSASSVHKASENESYSDCELSDDEKPGAAPVEELQSTSSEESDEQSPPAAKRSRLASRQQSSAESSSSEEEMPAKPVVSIDISSEDETVTAERPVSAGRKPYALRREELPSELREFLLNAKSFFTRPHSLQRAGQHIASTTYAKAEERILCYLGHVKRNLPRQRLTSAVFQRFEPIEDYLDHLKQVRGLSSSTISNHASSLIYPLKYLYRNLAPNFAAVPLIAQLRRMATILQKKGDLDRPKTREDLKALNKWLDWDEVLEAAALQRSRFEVARGKRHRAREAADLLLLSLYCHIPPSRGLEMRTLEVVHEADLQETFSPTHFPNRNIALLQNSGDVVIHVQLFKTFRFAGRDSITLQVDSELCRLFKQYVKDFRSELLCSGEASHHLFVNSNGLPYSSGAFSRHIKNLMARLTGRQVSINTLRSSFLTWAYSRSDCDDTLKDSLAAALRHSREQAQNTYDRRTANEKKAAALDLARRKAEEGPDRQAVGASDQPSEPDVGVGQFVGLVGEESTLQKPCIFLGRVQALLPDGQVCLLWYKNVGGGVYSLEVDGSQWLESKDALVSVRVAAARGRLHSYRLMTSLRSIHKEVHGGGRD